MQNPNLNQWFSFAILITGLILIGEGMFLLIGPPQYQATATVALEPDNPNSYDPFFIQTTFEIIRSELVLTNVIASLDLNMAWGKKYGGGEPLKPAKTLFLLQKQLRFKAVRNTRLITISYISTDPVEAAQIANAVAEAYKTYRVKSSLRNLKAGRLALQENYSEEEDRIASLQSHVTDLHQSLGIQDSAATNGHGGQETYWEEKQKLENLVATHQLLGSKIKAQTNEFADGDAQPINDPMVEITDRAMPPKNPVGPNSILGGLWLMIGILFVGVGFVRLRPAKI